MTLNLAGEVYGRLTVISEDEKASNGDRRWLCRCECGSEVVVRQRSLRSTTGGTKSCGCLQKEKAVVIAVQAGKRNRRHGMTKSTEWRTWQGMWNRCTNPRSSGYRYYGAKGVSVCSRWKSFDNFIADMGLKPSPRYSLDRIDPNQEYSPDNCRWADDKTQQRNRRWHRMLTFRGETRCASEWAEVIGVSADLLYDRILRQGWDVERALTTPPRPRAKNKTKPADTLIA